MNLPHRFPFRLVDRTAEGRGIVRASVGDWWRRGAEPPAAAWLIEAVAQSAALVLAPAESGEPPRLALAAVEHAELERSPMPGETLTIDVVLEGRFGGLSRVRGELAIDGRPAGRATVVLTAG